MSFRNSCSPDAHEPFGGSFRGFVGLFHLHAFDFSDSFNDILLLLPPAWLPAFEVHLPIFDIILLLLTDLLYFFSFLQLLLSREAQLGGPCLDKLHRIVGHFRCSFWRSGWDEFCGAKILQMSPGSTACGLVIQTVARFTSPVKSTVAAGIPRSPGANSHKILEILKVVIR